jgi:hypothetical protein
MLKLFYMKYKIYFFKSFRYSLFKVLPVDKTEGLIECVENAHPFLEFKIPGDNKDSTSTDALSTFIEKEPERKGNLFRTFLGFVVSGIVLQLADRHGKDRFVHSNIKPSLS